MHRESGGSAPAGARPERQERSDRPSRPFGGRGPGGPGGERRPFKKKVCRYCSNKKLWIDYKDAKALRPFITERGKIMPRRISGACAKHQRSISIALKRARALAIIPFTAIALERE